MSVDQADPGRGNGGGDPDLPDVPATDAAGEPASAPTPALDPPVPGDLPPEPAPAADVPPEPAPLVDVPAGPAPAADVPAGAGRRPRRLVRGITLVLLVLVGLAGVGGGGFSVAHELTRHATSTEQAAAIQAEIASRWQRLPAGKIFPAAIPYTSADFGAALTARRVGIAPRATCAAALDPAVASLLRKYGCVAVLRATYLDPSGTLTLTAGVVVMTSTAAANRAVGAASALPAQAGVRTFSLPGTVADQFGDPERRAFNAVESIGPYVFLYAAGYTDGRVSGSAATSPAFTDLGSGVVTGLQTVLTFYGSACTMKDIRC